MNLSAGVGGKVKGKIPLKRIVIISVVLLLIAAAAVLGKNYFKENNNRGMNVPQQTAVVHRGDLSVEVSGSGPISSANKYVLTSNVSGTLTRIYFRDGDKVKAGDLIFEIDDRDAQLQIKQLRNSIAQAQLTRDDHLKEIQSNTVTAPIDGEIVDLQVKEGDRVSKNSTLLTITDKSKLKLLVSFNNTYRNKLFEGQKVKVNAYDQDRDELYVLEGSISSISTPSYTTSEGTEVYNVSVVIENSGSLNDGMIGSVEINMDGTVLKSKGSNTLSYLRSMTVKAASEGTIVRLNAENGQNVTKGDILAELDNDDLALTIQTENLKLEDLNLQLQTAEKKLLDYKIYAPFDGTFTLNDVEQGNSIKQGDILGSVANYDIMEFTIDVDELDIANIKIGQNARITIDALPETTDNPLKGTVTKIAVEGSSSNGVSTYPVTVQIEQNPALKGGMNANAEIIVEEKTDVLYVPVDAIIKRSGKSYVRVVKGAAVNGNNRYRQPGEAGQRPAGNTPTGNMPPSNAQAGNIPAGNMQPNNAPSGNKTSRNNAEQQIEMREVKTGISNAEYIEIVSGLKEGEVVAVTSSSNSANNMRGNMMIMGGPPQAGGPGRRGN